ncbi:hypothetical protein TNCV_2359141 [Trichonephila clavipes]|nr:hypothetical protein TNCV_2359141 [Trichonephila clavipes]
MTKRGQHVDWSNTAAHLEHFTAQELRIRVLEVFAYDNRSLLVRMTKLNEASAHGGSRFPVVMSLNTDVQEQMFR